MTTLIGTNPDQVPVNSMLGGMAYQDPESIKVRDLTVVSTATVDTANISSLTSPSASITNLSYSGTLTGGTGVINIGSSQIYKDAAGNVSLGGSGALKLNEGTTAQQPASPSEGMIRKNSTTGRVSTYLRGTWVNLVEESQSTRNNLLDNAGFIVDNRFRGTSHVGAGNVNKFMTDRWIFKSIDPHSSTNLSFGVTTDNIAPVTYAGAALTLQSNASATLSTTTMCKFGQFIDSSYQKHSRMTLSFMVKSSITGTYSFYLLSNTKRYIGTFTIDVANTFEKKVISIPALNITAGSDGQVYTLMFNLGTHSSLKVTPSGVWDITTTPAFATGCIDILTTNAANLAFVEMKLEYGDIATPFTLPSYAEDLDNCRLHYQQSGLSDDKFLFSTTYRTSAQVTGLFTPFDTVCLSPRMRELPTVTIYNPITAAQGSARNNTAGTNIPVLLDYSSEVSFKVYVNNTSVNAGDKLHIAWEAATGF